MRASWFSRRGCERKRNSDAATLGQKGRNVIAVLVDGAEKGPRGAELARHWAEVAFRALAEVADGSSESVSAHLKHEQSRLRTHFLHDVASYCMVRVDLEKLAGQVWHCGDCRVGVQDQTEMRWLTAPHILTEQPGIPLPPGAEERSQLAQVLTRSLTARRFRKPDYQSLMLQQQGQELLLCTDGYWIELVEAGTAPDEPFDDASLLTLSIGAKNLELTELNTDADNFILNERCPHGD